MRIESERARELALGSELCDAERAAAAPRHDLSKLVDVDGDGLALLQLEIDAGVEVDAGHDVVVAVEARRCEAAASSSRDREHRICQLRRLAAALGIVA